MADGRHLQKLLNRYNCAAVPSTFTKLRILSVSTPWTVKISNFFKSKMADVPILQNRHNSAMVQLIAMKFYIVTHFNPLKPTPDQNLDF